MGLSKLLLFVVLVSWVVAISGKSAVPISEQEKIKTKAAFEAFRARRLEERKKDPNRRETRTPREFNSPRLQRIWEEANIRYSPNQENEEMMKKIKEELVEISTMELKLKQGNEDKEIADDFKFLQKKIKAFFEKYERLQPRAMKLTPQNDTLLRDVELKRLWSRVGSMDFLEDFEIQELQNEFMYCQDRMKDLADFVNNDVLVGKIHKKGLEETGNALKEERISEDPEFAEFDSKMVGSAFGAYASAAKEVRACYIRLDHYTNSTFRKEGFKEPIPSRLWVVAQRTNMTDTEMGQFRAELRSFQGKLREQDGLERKTKALEGKLRGDPQLKDSVRNEMAGHVEKMKTEGKERQGELNKIYEALSSLLKSKVSHVEL